MSRLFRACCLLLFCLSARTISADPVTYTFEPPEFTANESVTALVNRSPNIGPATFFATFSSPGAFRIMNFQPNALFSGLSLLSVGPPSPPSFLTITFNMPVTEVEFSFALFVPGSIALTSSVGNESQVGEILGGLFTGGTFVFTSPTPFTSFQLQATDTTGGSGRFGIDNLTARFFVPEPSTLGLLAAGLLGIGWKKFRSKR